jgi:hypothetical protein
VPVAISELIDDEFGLRSRVLDLACVRVARTAPTTRSPGSRPRRPGRYKIKRGEAADGSIFIETVREPIGRAEGTRTLCTPVELSSGTP